MLPVPVAVMLTPELTMTDRSARSVKLLSLDQEIELVTVISLLSVPLPLVVMIKSPLLFR